LTAGSALTVGGACSSRLIRLFLAEPTLLLWRQWESERACARGAGQVVIMRIRLVPADALTVYVGGVSFG
jgi:hypothetical protein